MFKLGLVFKNNTKKLLGNIGLNQEFKFNHKLSNLVKFNFAEEGKGQKDKGPAEKKGKEAKKENAPPAKGKENKNQAGKESKNTAPVKEEEKTLAKVEDKEIKEFDEDEESSVDLENVDFNKLLGRKQPLKAEKYEISHNYEKGEFKAPAKTKKVLDNLVTQMLRNEGITSQEAAKFKTEIREPLNNAYGRHLTKIEDLGSALTYINSFSDFYFYDRTFECLKRLIKYQRETREESHPAYIQLRSQTRLVPFDQMRHLSPETADVRQNVNNLDSWLKQQPRMTSVDYAYNLEENREFYKNFSKLVEEDKKRTLEKQKLYKYIKLNPDNQQVRERFIPKMLPDGITPSMIPDYDVDISGYKPEVTKKSRRKYVTPKIDTNFKNYEAWRCFDRVFHVFSSEMEFIKVDLAPKYLIARFGQPDVPDDPNFTGTYYLEDENMDLFLIGDFMQTEEAHGPNYVDEFYEEQEKTVKPEWRVKKYPSADEFWESTERHEFRIYFMRHSEAKKFKRWLKVHVNYFNPQTDKTMDQILDEKFGKVDDYTDYNMRRVNKEVPAVYHYNSKYFMDKDDKSIIEHEQFVHPKYISPEEGEYFDYEEMMRQEARKAAKGGKVDKEEEMREIAELFTAS